LFALVCPILIKKQSPWER